MDGWMRKRIANIQDQLCGRDDDVFAGQDHSTFLVNDQDFEEHPGRERRSNFGRKDTPTLLSLSDKWQRRQAGPHPTFPVEYSIKKKERKMARNVEADLKWERGKRMVAYSELIVKTLYNEPLCA